MIKIHVPGVNMKVCNHADHFEVSLLIVTEEKRNLGLGTCAIRCLQQFGRAIRLTAIPHIYKKAALHRFYQRLGFRPVGKDTIGNTNFEWTPGGAK
jgi:RimJ/RimL family protein N-acetyltransferase